MENQKQIISAEEAKEMVKAEMERDDTELIQVMDNIRKAIKRKDYYCHTAATLHDYTVDKLKALGYKIEYMPGDSQREPACHKITWK